MSEFEGSEFRGVYVNPELSDEEALGMICVFAHPYWPKDKSDDRLSVLASAIMNGIPGRTSQGLMSPEEAMAAALKTEALHAQDSPQAMDRRQVTAYVASNHRTGKAGLVVYDSSVPWDSPDSVRPDGTLVRETAFAVASGTSQIERFTLNQMSTIGAALGYSTLKDMQARGFERVRYEFEGLGLTIDPEEPAHIRGVTVESEMAAWQTGYPWLADA
jgi:hypothetical protein